MKTVMEEFVSLENVLRDNTVSNETKVEKILNIFSLDNKKNKRYKYLRDAIVICLKDNTFVNSSIENLYYSVAKKYYCSQQAVNKGINFFLKNNLFQNDNCTEELKAIQIGILGRMAFERKKMTGREFIPAVVYYLEEVRL